MIEFPKQTKTKHQPKPPQSEAERIARLERLCESLVVQVYDLAKENESLKGLIRRLLRSLKREREGHGRSS